MNLARDTIFSALIEAVVEQKLIIDRANRLSVASNKAAKAIQNLKSALMITQLHHNQAMAGHMNQSLAELLELYNDSQAELDEILTRSAVNSSRVTELLKSLGTLYPEDHASACDAVRLWSVGGNYASLTDALAATSMKKTDHTTLENSLLIGRKAVMLSTKQHATKLN